MKLKRRDFLKGLLTAAALAPVSRLAAAGKKSVSGPLFGWYRGNFAVPCLWGGFYIFTNNFLNNKRKETT